MFATLTATLLVLLPVAVLSLSSAEYGPTFTGDGTYFGATEAGNCALRQPRPSMYADMVPVAINDAQYDDSKSCGACLNVTGSGHGSGSNPIVGNFIAYVMDRCPECNYGDIDLSRDGDGRWDVSWRFIECPVQDLSFLFEGSNEYYWKMQPRGLRSPATQVLVNGVAGERTQDNFYIFPSGPFSMPANVSITTSLDKRYEVSLGHFLPDGVVTPL